jgi:concanavalin A-like lectin/glucanase superfamily protein
MAVDPGRAIAALVALLPFAACTSDHPFIDPALFYGADAGVVTPPPPQAPGAEADAGVREPDAAASPSPPLVPAAPDSGCSDEDRDSICDDLDLCPGVAHQDDAADVDADGVPDACDPCGVAVALALAPLFYFRFDETSGAPVAQNSGSANPGADYVGGAATFAHGVTRPERAALHLPGQDNTAYPRVTVAGVTQFPSDAVTLSVWLRTSQTSDFAVLSYATGGDPNHFLISFLASGPLRVGVQSVVVGTASNVTSTLADGQWHHVLITGRVGSELRYYVDAELIDHVTMPPGSALDPGGVLIIGQDQDSLNGGFDVAQAFEGDMDELALYDHELDLAQIESVFAATTCL